MEKLKKCKRLLCFLLVPFLIEGISEILFHAQPIRDFILRLLVREDYNPSSKVILNFEFDGIVWIIFFITICVSRCLDSESTIKYKIQKPAINVDYISKNDKDWIEEIKQKCKNGDKLIAYSSKGAFSAREKAIILGIYECFDEFLSQEEFKQLREK